MPENYASASEMIRNLDKVTVPWEVIQTQGKFRIVQFARPYWEGYEFWIVNEKGFFWEQSDTLEGLLAYLETEEAKDYQNT